MGDKVLTETDIHWIVKIFQKSSSLISNKDLVCGALGLTLAESDEITSRVRMEGSTTYKHFSLVISKWIEKNSVGATLNRLAFILRSEEFTSTADELLKTVESSPTVYTQNDDTERVTSTAKKFDELEIQKSSVNGVQNRNNPGKCKLPHQPRVEIIETPPIPNLKTKKFGIDENFKAMNLDSGQTGSYVKEIVELKGSQIEFDSFLGIGRRKCNNLKSIQFNNVKMNWSEFWDCVDNFKTMETIQLINPNLHFIPARTILLPNMKKYVLRLDENSSDDILRTLEQTRKNHAEVKYPVEYLIPFVKNNLEDIWSTCMSLKYVRLDLVVSSKNVIFLIDKDNFEFKVDRSYLEHHQNSNETQCSILPNFLQSFQVLKKLSLTNTVAGN